MSGRKKIKKERNTEGDSVGLFYQFPSGQGKGEGEGGVWRETAMERGPRPLGCVSAG